jgi:predicted ATP-grasp superfamily ATP-dependent carboligase
MLKKAIIFPAPFIGSVELKFSVLSIAEPLLPVYRQDYVRRFKPKGSYIVDEFKSAASLLRKIEGWGKENNVTFSGVIGLDDEFQFRLTKKISEHFGLNYYNEETLRISSNKFLMKQQFDKNKVPTARYRLISDMDAGNIGFPSILKIISGSGSEYIYKNRDKEELHLNFARLLSNAAGKNDSWFCKVRTPGSVIDPKKQFLLEEFLEGDEYSLDFILKKEVRILRVVKKFHGKNVGYFRGFYLMNDKTLEKEGISVRRLEELCMKIAKSLKIDQGVCMVDFINTNEGIKVIETSVRPGLSLFIPLMWKIYGYTSVGILSKLASGQYNGFNRPDTEGAVICLTAQKPGRLVRLDTSRLNKINNIIEIHTYNKPGCVIHDSEVDHHDLLLGYVLVKKPDIKKIFKEIEENVIIETEHA